MQKVFQEKRFSPTRQCINTIMEKVNAQFVKAIFIAGTRWDFRKTLQNLSRFRKTQQNVVGYCENHIRRTNYSKSYICMYTIAYTLSEDYNGTIGVYVSI